MVRYDAEVNAEYGTFVSERLSSYKRRDERQYGELGEDELKRRLEYLYKQRYDINKQIYELKNKLISEWNNYLFAIVFWICIVVFFVLLLMGSGFGVALVLIFLLLLLCLFVIFVVSDSYPQIENDFKKRHKFGIILNEVENEKYRIDSPIRSYNYELTKRISEDRVYSRYLNKINKYKTTIICPICNSNLKITRSIEPPFQSKCENCDYIFTVIYQERKEKFTVTTFGPRGGVHEKSHYISYDGVKAIKPKTQRVTYVEKKIQQNIKDSIIYKSKLILGEEPINIEDSIIQNSTFTNENEID